MNIEHGHRITTDSFYDGQLASSKQEVEISILTSKESLLRDIIEALAIINNKESHKLTITIVVDNQGRTRLIKKWVI